MHILAVIPARFQSVRFPGKPLVDIKGKPMIQRVFQQVSQSQLVNEVIVATDSKEIFDYCLNAQIPVLMTSDEHQSGTDRVAEVAGQKNCDIVINIQADEPFLPPSHIDELILSLSNSSLGIATLVAAGRSLKDFRDQSVVKAVRRSDGRALYFSRQPIPFSRDGAQKEINFWQHLGIYAFRREILEKMASLPRSSLELTEKLEQLRWLESGQEILTVVVPTAAKGIDTPSDLADLLTWMEINDIP